MTGLLTPEYQRTGDGGPASPFTFYGTLADAAASARISGMTGLRQ